MVASPEGLRELIEPALASSGLELWDVEVSRDSVRVLVDRCGGIDLDSLAAVAGKVVSPLLDSRPDLTPEGSFQLEVSSPGVERNLRTVEHYQRYVGSEVSVKTRVAVEGARRHHGKLVEVTDSGITLAPKDAPAGSVVQLPFEIIDRTRTVLVWGPAGKGDRAQGGQGRSPAGQNRRSKAVKRSAATGQPSAGSQAASIDAKEARS